SIDGDVAERFLKILALGRACGDRLRVDRSDIVTERYRSRPPIGTDRGEQLGLFTTLIRKRVDVVIERSRAGVRQPVPRFEFLEPPLENAEGKTQLLGQATAGRLTQDVQMLADEGLDQGFAQARLLQVFRFERLEAAVVQQSS